MIIILWCYNKKKLYSGWFFSYKTWNNLQFILSWFTGNSRAHRTFHLCYWMSGEDHTWVSYWRRFVSRNFFKSCGCRVMISASRSISRQWYWPSRVTYGSPLSSSKYALVTTYKKINRFSELWPTFTYLPSRCGQIMNNLQNFTLLLINQPKIRHAPIISIFSLQLSFSIILIRNNVQQNVLQYKKCLVFIYCCIVQFIISDYG